MPEQAENPRLVSPRPEVEVEVQVGPAEHLSVHGSGVTEAEAIEMVARALTS